MAHRTEEGVRLGAWYLVVASVALALPLAAAHANYTDSTPGASEILGSAPDAVTVRLSEPIQPGRGSIRVTNDTGGRVESGPTVIDSQDPHTMSVPLSSLGPGVYTATWTAVSAADGHYTAGSFSFAVRNPDGTIPCCLPSATVTTADPGVDPLEAVARGGSFLGLAIALGTTAFLLLVWIPSSTAKEDAFIEGYRRLVAWGRGGALLLVAGVGALWGITLTRAPPLEAQDLVGSAFLASLAARLVLGVAMVGALASAPDLGTGRDVPRRLLLASVLAGGAVVAGTLGSHGAATAERWPIGPLADAIHMAAASLWVGGLLAIFRVRDLFRRDDALPLAREALPRFSRLAGRSVALLLAAGVALALVLLGDVGALTGTSFGWVVLAKGSLFVPMVALGAYSRYRLLPKIARPTPDRIAVDALGQKVRIEAALGVTVILLAGLLTTLNPTLLAVAEDPTFSLEQTADDLLFEFLIYPFPREPGVYTYVVLLYDAETRTVYDDGRNMTLRFSLPGSSLEAQDVPMDGPHGNHYIVDSPAVSQAGRWQIDVRVDRVGGLPSTATFHVTFGGSA